MNAERKPGAKKMARTSRKVTADICLYGTSRTGAGFLVCRLDHGQVGGSGNPVEGRSFTEAVWLGVETLRGLGVTGGILRIFEPGGERMSVVDFNNVPAFGALKWEPATFYTVQITQITK